MNTETYLNYSEALEAAAHLSKVTRRRVEVKAINCDCDYSPLCCVCAGSGTYFVNVYGFCDHLVREDDRDEECFDHGCAERERAASVVEARPGDTISAPLKSLLELNSEREEAAA